MSTAFLSVIHPSQQSSSETLSLGNSSAVGAIKKPGRPHLARWWNHVEALDVPKKAIESSNEAKKDWEKHKKVKRTESVEVVLPNATVGKVVLRFGKSRRSCYGCTMSLSVVSS